MSGGGIRALGRSLALVGSLVLSAAVGAPIAGQPMGPSLICLGCHGSMYGLPDPFPIGINLTNDHPVSLVYPTAAQDADFRVPPDLTTGWGPGDLKLYGERSSLLASRSFLFFRIFLNTSSRI